jgi:lipoate---protein ligase
MHGEYKTPNGKLIAVDLEVADGKLRDVMVSGDFFLYPEEALADMTGALEGLSAELSIAEIAEQVRAAMPRDAQLLGSSPDALATAVRRALSGDETVRPEGLQ